MAVEFWAEGFWATGFWADGFWAGEAPPAPVEPDVVVRVRGHHATTPDAPYDVRDGGLVVQDPSDGRVYAFDWDAENLGPDAAIETSTFTIACVDRPVTSPVTTLDGTLENEALSDDSRTSQVRVSELTIGALYRLTNAITTTESPDQVKDRSILIRVELQ